VIALSEWWRGFCLGLAVAFIIATIVVEWTKKHDH
jgi:hypothetical protein